MPPGSWIDLGEDHLSVRIVLEDETLLDAEPVDIPYGELFGTCLNWCTTEKLKK